jgi:hypothetical protein
MKKIVVLVPFSSHIEHATDCSLRELEKKGVAVWRMPGFSAIDQGRCVMAQLALDAGFDLLFWIDSDVNFKVEDFFNLIESGKEFVTGAYSVKGWPSLTTVFCENDILFGVGGCLHEANYSATGFMCTHKSVYEKIAQKFKLKKVQIWGGQYEVLPYFFPLLFDNGNKIEYLGEDFAFCHRARQSEIKIWCDTRIKLEHIGKHGYSFEFLQNGIPPSVTSFLYSQQRKY